MSILLLILGLIMFVGLVVVHEFGHYKAARAAGVVVEEFGIGFPPKLWKKHLKNGTLFTLNLIPLGGFVRLKGEHDSDSESGSYGAATDKQKIKIMIAGVVMNLVTAFGLLGLLALIGMPKLFENQFNIARDSHVVRQDVLVGYVEPGSPAAQAGIQPKDKIDSVRSDTTEAVRITSSNQLIDITKEFAGQAITLEVRRDNTPQDFVIKLRSQAEVEASQNTDHPKGYLGLAPGEITLVRNTWSAPIVALGTIGQFTWLTLHGLGAALKEVFTGHAGQAANQVAGPVGIFVLIKDGATLGPQFILMIMAVISLTLAIMNVLPIPALDGGKLFVTLLYRWAKKPLTPKTEELIHGIGFVALILLFILITIIDIKRFF
jgi:regulator of sigma E protease